jgi:signal transduction histidine kinase
VAELLQSQGQVDLHEVHGFASRLQRSVKQMQSLIADLLDFAKIQTGTFSVEKFDENPEAIILQVTEDVRALAEAKRQRLEVDIAPSLPAVSCDAARMEQVLSNLLGNAIKFTPEGGVVRVVAKESTDGVLISISDTGPGIPAEQLERVFDRYWQAHETKRLGNGLGLSIAKGIVEAHGARIWAESQPGKGSCFSLTIPLGR